MVSEDASIVAISSYRKEKGKEQVQGKPLKASKAEVANITCAHIS